MRTARTADPYWLGNLSNTPIEVIEAENPLLIEEYGFPAGYRRSR